MKKEDSLRDLWDNIKCINVHIIEVPKGEEREKEAENSFEEIIAENFLNLEKETDIQVQEGKRVPNNMKQKRPTQKHTIIKMAKIKDKERILKAARGKQLVMYKGTPIRQLPDFSAEMLQARRQWHNIFKVLKEKKKATIKKIK